MHRGGDNQHTPWPMTEGQSVCDDLGNSPGNANADSMLQSLHVTVPLGIHTSTATGRRDTEWWAERMSAKACVYSVVRLRRITSAATDVRSSE